MTWRNSRNAHHVPNVLAEGHTRGDHDFLYADNVMGPIRLPELANTGIPAQVWCRRHGWEEEITHDVA